MGRKRSKARTGAEAGGCKDPRSFPVQINRAIILGTEKSFPQLQAGSRWTFIFRPSKAPSDNIGNIRDDTTPHGFDSPSQRAGEDQARLELKMTLDPFSYRPTFHLAMRLLGLDVTKINVLGLAYGKFDFQRGWFDFVFGSGRQRRGAHRICQAPVSGSESFSLTEELKRPNPLQFFWQALVGGATGLLKNYSRDSSAPSFLSLGTCPEHHRGDVGDDWESVAQRFYSGLSASPEGGQDAKQPHSIEAHQFNETLSVGDSSLRHINCSTPTTNHRL
jgi:hypothetical protein